MSGPGGLFYCTYCSARKRRDPGEIPAVDRYDNPRIHAVHERAQKEGAGFLILSGEYGLLAPADPIPYYDHLLQRNEVGPLVDGITVQLQDHGVRELVYFTAPLEKHKQVRPYHDLLAAACSRKDVLFRKVMLEPESAETGSEHS